MYTVCSGLWLSNQVPGQNDSRLFYLKSAEMVYPYMYFTNSNYHFLSYSKLL